MHKDENDSRLKIEHRAIRKLRPYDRNSRKHGEAQIASLGDMIGEYGWTQPILVDETDRIIAGHARFAAAKKLGKKTVPVIVARGWSEEQIKAYVIQDNRIAERAEWDQGALALELLDLKEAGFDINLLGWDNRQLEDIFDLKTAFEPLLAPEMGKAEVSAEDIAHGQEKLDNEFKDRSVQELVEVDCPHCGATITLNRDSL